MIDQITKQMQLLNMVNYPFSLNELTQSYNKLLKENHPDINKDPKANEKTIKIIEAYKFLKPYSSREEIKKTSLIHEFGHCYKPCDRCQGTGQIIISSQRIKGYDCIKCKDTGIIQLKCNKCNNGKFTLKNGRIINCRICHGTGIFKLKCNHIVSYREQLFHNLFGPKEEWIDIKSICRVCDGTGEVEYEPVNPVISKNKLL